ncbi:MAG: NrtA/SsuA/CpmA family ABC transporter substrate-binding protein [Methanoregula sp.]
MEEGEVRMDQKKTRNILIIVACVILILAGAWYFSQPPAGFSGTPDQVSIGSTSDESSALIFVAEDQGYFTKNGLNLTLRKYPNGAAAIHGMETSDVDISLSAEYPFVVDVLEKKEFLVVGSINKYYGTYVVARKDRGIVNISDLRGKRIAVPGKTIGEFYIARFLDLNGINKQDVTLVDKLPAQSIPEFTGNGSVDALVTRKFVIESKIGPLDGNYTVWPSQNNQATYNIISIRKDWSEGHPDTIRRLLLSLEEAERYSLKNPDEAKAIVRKNLNMSDSYMASVWPEHQFSLSLDQSLILAMEDEARWIIANNQTDNKEIPNFLNYLYPDGMNTVKPGSVNIIR